MRRVLLVELVAKKEKLVNALFSSSTREFVNVNSIDNQQMR